MPTPFAQSLDVQDRVDRVFKLDSLVYLGDTSVKKEKLTNSATSFADPAVYKLLLISHKLLARTFQGQLVNLRLILSSGHDGCEGSSWN